MNDRTRSATFRRLHDDSGVVAVVVALSMSTFLLGFAALAVDLGLAYSRKVELQAIADALAVSTANALPAVTGVDPDTGDPGAVATFDAAFWAMCQAKGRGIWDASICPQDPATAPNLGWAYDGDPANGQVEFATNPKKDLNFVLPAAAGAPPAEATAVQVVLPPSTVEFGFTALVGPRSTELQKSASARIGTPLGSGILPFALTPQDVSNGQFCVTDPAVTPTPPIHHDPAQPTFPAFAWLKVTPDSLDPLGDDFTVTLVVRGLDLTTLSDLKVYSTDTNGPIATTSVEGRKIVFEAPKMDPGAEVKFWVRGHWTFGIFQGDFTSTTASVRYSGKPDTGNPCLLPQASSRGYIQLARSSGTDSLTSNVRTSPQVQLYPLLGGVLDPVNGILGSPTDLCVAGLFSPATSCAVSKVGTPFSDRLQQGLFTGGQGQDGRMIRRCGDGATTSGGYSDIERTNLFAVGNGLVDSDLGGVDDLRDKIVAGVPASDATRGWITGAALRCARMVVMPVVDSNPVNPVTGMLGGNPILRFVYVWIDGPNASRGVLWSNGHVQSVRGYVIDPRYLPDVVAGAGVVGPYLGGDMPKEATLMCDLPRRPTAEVPDPPDRCAR